MQPSNNTQTNEILVLLRNTTDNLYSALTALAAGHIRVQAIAEAFGSIRRVSEVRIALPSSWAEHNKSLRQAWSDYHSALRDWHKELPRIHGWLLAEKARLEGRRLHAQSVHTWIETNQQTR